MRSCFFGNHSILADCITTFIVPNTPIQLSSPRQEGVVVAHKPGLLNAPPPPEPAESWCAAALFGLVADGNVDLNAFCLQLSAPRPRAGAGLPLPGPTPRPAPRDSVRTTVPGARTFGIGAFSFWQPRSPSCFCFSVSFLLCHPLLAKDDVAEAGGRACRRP